MFTEDEIRSVVDQLLPQNVGYARKPVSGLRDFTTTFQNLMEATATILLRPEAFYWLVSLSRDLANELLETEREYLNELRDLVQYAASPNNTKIDNTRLVDAKNALLQLENSVALGGSIVGSSQYDRFLSSSTKFLTQIRSRIVRAGNALNTWEDVKDKAPGLLTSAASKHDALIKKLTGIVGAEDALDDSDVAKIAVLNVVKRARVLISSRIKSGTSDAEERKQLRQAVLELLTAKSILNNMGTYKTRPVYLDLTGTLSPYTDADHPLESATVTSLAGSFDIRSSNCVLSARIDSGATTTVTLSALSEVLYLDGTLSEPFTFRSTGTKATLATESFTSVTTAGETFTLFFSVYTESPPSVASTVVQVTLPTGVLSRADFASLVQTSLVSHSLDSTFEAVTSGNRVEIRALNSGSYYKIQLKAAYPVTEYFGWGDEEYAEGLDPNNILSLRTGTHEEWITFLDGTYTADEVATRINTTKTAALLVVASSHTVTYAVPAFAVLRLTGTDSSSGATLEVLSTYNDGTDHPALAGRDLGLTGCILRSNQKTSAESILSQLRATSLDSLADLTGDGTYVTIKSKLLTSASKVELSGTACSTLFGSSSVTEYGDTFWVSMSVPSDEVHIGDVLEAWGSTYSIISYENGLMKLGSSISMGTSPVSFSTTCRIRSSRKGLVTVLASTLSSWLDVWGDTSGYYALTAKLNAYLASTPSSASTNDVIAAIDALIGSLNTLETYLLTYSVEQDYQLDNAIRAWSEKGCQRAVDILLDCDFDNFFAITSENASYAGALKKEMKGLAQGALSISRSDRAQNTPRDFTILNSTDPDSIFEDTK